VGLYFSACCFALRSFSPGKLNESLEETGNKSAPYFFTEKVEKLIWAASCYRWIVNAAMILVIVFAFDKAETGEIAFTEYGLILVISSALVFVFSIALPHSIAKYGGEVIVSRTLPFLNIIFLPLWLVRFFFEFCDKFVRRLAGLPQATGEQIQEEKQEEFLTDLRQLRFEGTVDKEEQKMIQGVLKLSQTSAEEIMTPRTDIVAVELHSDLKEVIETITSAGHTRVPVFDGNIDNIIGFVYAKDLLREIGKNTEDFKLSDRLRKPYFVPETKILRELLHEFQAQKLHISVILDEYGGTAGIATLEDVLEELVGEIADEYESTPPEQITQVDTDTIEVDARTYINEINEQYQLNLPEGEDYDTVGGFVFSYLGYIPKTGEKFDYGNLKFVITSAEPRRINYLKIKTIDKESDTK
jgi:CBS domain containing-hemolysin-like protein